MKRTPNIRFKGFDGEWEEKALGEIFDERNERSANGELLSVSIKHGVSRAEEIERTTSTTDYSHYKVVKKGDIAYNTMRMWQGACGHSEYDGIVSPAYTVVAPQNTEYAPFYSFMFRTNRMLHEFRIFSQGLTSDTWNIKYPIFAGLKIDRPKKDEQKCTAAFIEKLDTLISQRTKEVEKMRNIKRALLEKMFPQDGESVPQIRFKEFTGDWEEKKVMDIANRVTRKNSNLESKLPLCISAQLGLVSQLEYYNNTVVGSNIANYFLIRKGEFAYNKSAAGEFPMGAIKRLDKHDCGILSTLYIAFALKPNVDSDYIVAHYETKPWQCDVKKRIAVGARNHGLLNISPNDFMESLVVTPKTKEEQSKVGKLFAYLDTTISARDRQITLLKNLKLALLEQMFVNN